MNIISTDCGTHIRLMVEGRVDTNTSPQFQQAILNAFQKKKAKIGIIVNCARQPIKMSFGLVKTSLKSSSFNVRPMPNITIINK